MDKPELRKQDTLEYFCNRCRERNMDVSEDAVKYAMVEATVCDLGYALSWPIPEYLARFNDKYSTEDSFPETLSPEDAEDIWETTANGFTDWVTPKVKDVMRWDDTLKERGKAS